MEQNTQPHIEEPINQEAQIATESPGDNLPPDPGSTAATHESIGEESAAGLPISDEAATETDPMQLEPGTSLSSEQEQSLMDHLNVIFAEIHEAYRTTIDSFYENLAQAQKARVDQLTGSFETFKKLLQQEIATLIREPIDQDSAAVKRRYIFGNTHTMFGLLFNILQRFAEQTTYKEFEEASGHFTAQIHNLVDRILEQKLASQ